MATQSTTYNTDGTTRTFPSTKPIPTISHVGVYLKRVSDNVWVQVNVGDYTLVQSSIIMDTAPDVLLYSQLEVRVADDPAEITTSPSNIAIVAGDTTAINTVATNIGAVTTVSTNIGAVTNVSANIASVNTVSTDIVKVRTVADNITNVNTVSTNIANVNAVGADLLEPISEINTVATDIANVNIVGAAITNVNTVATNITNVNSVATTVVPNIAEILLADDNATIATNKALEASNSATAALGYLNDFKGRYYGALASDPILDPLGAAIGAGDLYFNTTLVPPRFRTYSGVVWQDAFTGDASGVANTPSGLISSTNVQSAINELDTEKAPLASPALTGTPTINGSRALSVNTTAYDNDLTAFIANTLASGAIIERGSNANGSYIKFADGTLICTYNATVTDQAITTAYGTLFTGTRTWTFPHVFVGTTAVMTQGKWSTQASWNTVGSATTTAVTVYFLDIASRATGSNTALNFIAIGRWK